MFKLPNFNLDVNIWIPPHSPGLEPPDVVVKGQLRYTGKLSPVSTTAAGGRWSTMEVLLPKGTNVVDLDNGLGSASIIEIPAGSKRYYRALYVDDVAKGFENEYRIVYVYKDGTWPTPIP